MSIEYLSSVDQESTDGIHQGHRSTYDLGWFKYTSSTTYVRESSTKRQFKDQNTLRKPLEYSSRRTLANASGNGHVIDGNVSCVVCSPYPLEDNLSIRKNSDYH